MKVRLDVLILAVALGVLLGLCVTRVVYGASFTIRPVITAGTTEALGGLLVAGHCVSGFAPIHGSGMWAAMAVPLDADPTRDGQLGVAISTQLTGGNGVVVRVCALSGGQVPWTRYRVLAVGEGS